MQLKLDENMPRPLAESLRRLGHDVHSASDEGLLGKSDRVVWGVVVQEGRLLLTLDRDFGQLASDRALALAADIDMTSRIVIFEDERIHIRPPLDLVPPQDQQ